MFSINSSYFGVHTAKTITAAPKRHFLQNGALHSVSSSTCVSQHSYSHSSRPLPSYLLSFKIFKRSQENKVPRHMFMVICGDPNNPGFISDQRPTGLAQQQSLPVLCNKGNVQG